MTNDTTGFSSNKDIVDAALKAAGEFYDKFSSQRKEWEEVWQVADYMTKAAQNRTLNTSEMTKGVNPAWEDGERAETGSTSFFRLHRQLASQLASVAFSRDLPFKYKPIGNDNVFNSYEESDAMATQWNTLAQWTLKQDGFRKKFIDFSHQLKKYGNIPVLVYRLHFAVSE